MPARITFLIGLVTVSLLLVLAPRTETQSLIPSQGDVYVSLETGLVQWRTPDDTLRAVLVGQIAGPAEGMRFDEGGNLGLAACAGRVLKFSRNQPPVAYSVEPEDRRLLWIDLAGDGCTLFYTSQGLDVKRFDVCTNTQLPNFNLKPMPGETQGLRVLSDGGVLVSSGAVIARLDDAGSLVQVYDVPTREPSYWVGLDLVPGGTFWVVDSASSNVYQFDLATGEVRGRFNTGAPSRTPVDVVVRRAKTPSAPGGVILR